MSRRPELGDRLVDQLGDLGLVAEIAGQDVNAAAQLGCELVELVGLAAGHGNGGPLLVQGPGDGAADAARRAGDERGLVGQLEHDVPYRVAA